MVTCFQMEDKEMRPGQARATELQHSTFPQAIAFEVTQDFAFWKSENNCDSWI